MSTQQNHYVVFGYSLPWKNVSWSPWENLQVYEKLVEPFSDSSYKPFKSGQMGMFYDGRDGNFWIFGLVLNSTENYGTFDLKSFEINDEMTVQLKKFTQEVLALTPRELKWEELILSQKPKIHIFTKLR